MKITRKGSDPLKGSTPAMGEPRVQPANVPSPAEAEAVSLSRLSTQMSASRASAGEPPFDAEQVERIKQAIRDGNFTVNAEAVADKLLEFEHGLGH